ncbi:MAG: sterol desaturase family protein, partial [Spirochaetia bacterium]|nr:sterol desaturase family protein [Spirochaetia bacterium]
MLYDPLEIFTSGIVLSNILYLFIFLVLLSIISSLIGFAIEKSNFGKRHKIFEKPLKPNQLKNEFHSSIMFVLINAIVISAGLQSGWINFSADSLFSFFYTFFIHYLLFEIWYYIIHRSMHSPAFFRFHKKHHDSIVTTPLTGLSMSSTESMIWALGYIGIPVLMSFFLPLNFYAWFVFLIYHWSGNILGHINAEIIPSFTATKLGSLFLHPFSYHSLHHARGKGHFALYAGVLDRI